MIGRFDQSPYESDGIANSIIIALLQQASKRHQRLFDGCDDEVRQLFYSSSPIMLLSLILFLCPNITALTPWSGYPEPSHRVTLLSHAISSLPHLRALTYATGFSKFPIISWKDESLRFIFSLPALRSLTIQVIEGVRRGCDPCNFPVNLQITTLHLHSSVLSSSSIGTLLSKLPNMRDLNLHLLKDNSPIQVDTEAADAFIDCPALASSLSQTSKTLERLVIICDFHISWSGSGTTCGFFSSGRDGNPGTLRNWGTKDTFDDYLRAFSKLRYLEIDPILLLGWGIENHPSLKMVLPKDLKSLKLRVDFPLCEDWKGNVPWVKLLMEEFLEMEGGDGFGALIYQVLGTHTVKYAKSLGELRRLCEKKGVLFGVEKLG